ncbi:MAG: TIGR04283 family arsenosugar biosynthesis glycosyltransferase [Bacteroidota bacterium]
MTTGALHDGHQATPPLASSLISVIVPALNEEEALAATLASVRAQNGPWEVILSDGGSTDATITVGRQSLSDLQVVSGARGRAQQMNAGAAGAAGSVLLFLHADTRLPDGALSLVRRSLADGAVGGCFRTAFDVPATDTAFGPVGRWAMRAWQARLWMRWHRLAFGDRALFVRRDVFESIGGFPEQPIFEDLDLVRHLRRRGRFAFLPADVQTSARRFRRHGAIRQQARNLSLWLGWLMGVDPVRLKRYYSDTERG